MHMQVRGYCSSLRFIFLLDAMKMCVSFKRNWIRNMTTTAAVITWKKKMLIQLLRHTEAEFASSREWEKCECVNVKRKVNLIYSISFPTYFLCSSLNSHTPSHSNWRVTIFNTVTITLCALMKGKMFIASATIHISVHTTALYLPLRLSPAYTIIHYFSKSRNILCMYPDLTNVNGSLLYFTLLFCLLPEWKWSWMLWLLFRVW